MKTVTQEQYVEAVDIIRRYHAQVESFIADTEGLNKTSVKKFLIDCELEGDISRRLSLRLKDLYKRWDSETCRYVENDDIPYLEDLTSSELMRIRNFGKKSLHEFEKLRSIYLSKK